MSISIIETHDDALLIEHYRQHWLDMGSSEGEIAAQWYEQASSFITTARQRHSFGGFCAMHDQQVLGSACCQLAERVYPAFHRQDAATIGYIWGVYVRPAARGHGLGRALVQRCIDHLTTQGCGRVLLHAGEHARPLYERLGFLPTDELGLRI